MELTKPIIRKSGGTINATKPILTAESFDVEETVELKKVTEPKGIQKLLQRQVSHEFGNERLYLSMALWCAENGYNETAKFFNTHALDEERKHGMDFVNHMLKRKMKVLTPVDEIYKREYTDLKEVLEDALEREETTSKMISEILQESIKTGDFAFTIASDYIKEQLEEEQLFNSLLNLYTNCNGSRIDFEMEVGTLKKSGKYKIGNL